MSQNYSELLYSHFAIVGNQSQQGRKIIEEIIDIFEERASIEEKYAKSLEKLVTNLAKMEDRQQYLNQLCRMFKIPIYCLKSIYASRKREAEGYHQSLREDLILQLKQLITQQNASSKKLIEEAKKLEKEHQFLNSETKRNFQEYKQKKREYEQNATVMVVYNLLSEYTEKKRINQYYKVNQVTKEVTDLEQKYRQSISDYNTNCEQAKIRMQAILTQMQEQEEKRIIVFKDALMRQIIFEVSHAKNVQYDLDKITEKLDEIIPHEEVNKFATQQKLENPPLFEKTELIQLNSYISNSLQKFFQKEFDEILQLNSDQRVKEIMKAVENGEQVQAEDAKQENALYSATLLSQSWKEEEVASEVFQELKQKVSDNYQLRKLIIIGLQQKRATSQFKLGPVAFANVTKIFNSILEICLETFDAGTARQLLNLSFTFNKDVTQEDKVKSYFIQNEFAQHKAWENRDLWETSIIQQIYEQLKEQQAKQKFPTLFDQISAEKNMILTILTQMAQNMMLFNFSIGAIKDIMSKFMAFFELNEEISFDLFNAIEGFEKQKQVRQTQEQEPPQQNVMGKISSFFSKT